MLSEAQLLGQVSDHVTLGDDGHSLHPECWQALARLQEDAAEAGFELAIASGFRDFERQRLIWNRKARGERPVLDDDSRVVELEGLSELEQALAIMRYSALPGTSRHHWGTDLDVYDAAAVPMDYAVQLTPQESSAAGPFAALHAWLDARIASGNAHGFFRPYARDLGGVAPERWHLSYAPLAQSCADSFKLRHLDAALASVDLELGATVRAHLDALCARFGQTCAPL